MNLRTFSPVLLSAAGKARQGGFSLIEIALVLVIVGLALGAGLAALGPQLQQRKYTETQRVLSEANDAIAAFVLVNRRLPCPATAASAGLESFCTNAVGACGAPVSPPTAVAGFGRGRCVATANTGFVPAATLGLGGQRSDGLVVDAWAQPLRYVVPATSNTTTNNTGVTPALNCGPGVNACFPYTQVDGFRNAYYNNLGTQTSTPASDVYVCSTAVNISAADCNLAPQRANPAFLVHSYGLNLNNPAGGIDETANTNADRVFVLHEKAETGAPNGAFDDLFSWVTIAQLTAKMSDGGMLR
ncbi:MAG: type II secretion system protein [Polaromonas sp.]|nr:type II secretion system protein [Polaromonas sp.]